MSMKKRLAVSTCFGLWIMWIGSAGSAAADPEGELRARIQSFWEAMVKSDYAAASLFVHPDGRNFFLHELPKSRYDSWKLEKLEFNGERTACKTVTLVKKPLPLFGAQLDWPLRHDWILENGEWYLTIPKSMSANPLQEMFRGEREVSSETRAMASAESTELERKETQLRAARILGRFTADAGNPPAMHAGQKAVFRYTYTNDGDVPIRILSVHADCHCTAVKQDYPELQPGGKSVLEITLDSFGLPLGRIEKDVHVQFSDFGEPVQLRISVDNKPNFVLMPAIVDFGSLRRGQQAGRQVRIVNESGVKVRFLPMPSADAKVGVSLDREGLEPGEEAICTIQYAAGVEGEILGSILLRTDLESEPLITLRISGKVLP